MECNLRVYVQRLKTITGSNRTCCPVMENRKGCLCKMAWQQGTGGTSGLIFSCGQHRKGLLGGGGWGGEAGRNREREIRSPDVYSLYTVSRGFGNKIGKNPTMPQSQTCMQGVHIYSGLRLHYVTLSKTNQLDCFLTLLQHL